MKLGRKLASEAALGTDTRREGQRISIFIFLGLMSENGKQHSRCLISFKTTFITTLYTIFMLFAIPNVPETQTQSYTLHSSLTPT